MVDWLTNWRIAVLLCLSILSGCANQALTNARALYHSGNYQGASEALQDCADFGDKFKLLCLIEKGTALYNLGEYKNSTHYFLRAIRFVEEKDYVSLSQQSSASLINDYMIVYQGERAEQLWMHSYLIMNFLLLDNYQSARVEAKQALEVLDDYPEALQKTYFTRGLIALCFEIFDQYQDARIEYEAIARQKNKPVSRPKPLSGDLGEAVLFVSSGKAPIKVAKELAIPPSIKISIPQYRRISYFNRPVVNTRKKADKHSIFMLSTDVFEVSEDSLNSRMKEIISRQTLRAAGKEAISRSFKNDELAEFLVRAALFSTEHADTRSWHTLPAGLHLIRLTLKPGRHLLSLRSNDKRPEKQIEVTIKPGQRVFKAVRF
ncbi:MAG: hypothetical protein CSA50_05360 [Gammaproteobacteria bacterium]|nr:MAG: hypothetical protein CSA50_05360 [Gammaproteobacteria bacterium]